MRALFPQRRVSEALTSVVSATVGLACAVQLVACSGGSESPTPGASPTPLDEPTPTAVPQRTPSPTPEATPTPGDIPTPPATPIPDPIPACRSVVGDEGGLEISLDDGDSLITNKTPLQAISYTWDVDVSPDGFEVLESFMNQLYRSTNSGCTFRKVEGVPENSIGFKDITRDPNDARRVFLTGYDEARLVRTDDGESWRNQLLTYDGTPITGVVAFSVDPVTPGVLRFVSAEGYYFVSIDDGSTWDRKPIPVIRTSQVYPVYASFSPDDPSHVIVATNTDGFVRTTNDGDTWVSSNSGIYVNGDTPENRSLVGIWVQHSPSDPSIVYGVIGYPDIDKLLYRSEDGGETWTLLTAGGVVVTGGTRIFVHPTDPDRFYTWFGTTFGDVYTDLYRCTVSGANVTVDTVRYDFPDLFGFAFHPLDPNILYLGRVNDAPQ